MSEQIPKFHLISNSFGYCLNAQKNRRRTLVIPLTSVHIVVLSFLLTGIGVSSCTSHPKLMVTAYWKGTFE